MNNVRKRSVVRYIYLPRSRPHSLPLIVMASVQLQPTVDGVVNLKPSDFRSFVLYILFYVCAAGVFGITVCFCFMIS